MKNGWNILSRTIGYPGFSYRSIAYLYSKF